jgi:hypothetical protein
MKYLSVIILFVIILVSSSATGYGQAKDSVLQPAAFIAGCWEMKIPGRKTVISEQWMMPEGDAMLGMNRTITNGKMSAFEYLRIVAKEDKLYYVAMPSENDSPTSFEIKSSSKNSIVFENLGHDFPQSITYTLTGPNSMIAAVEGLGNERPKRRRIEFPMVRVKCS